VSYVDTSIVVAALDIQDPRHDKVLALLEKESEKIVSEIVLAELASVVARRDEIVSSIAEKLGLNREEAIITILLYILKRFNLKLRSVEDYTRLPLLGRIYKPIAMAVELSTQVKLRTLDLLHVAYAILLKEEGEPILKLITADHDFEKARETLKKMNIDLHVIA